MTDTPPGGGPQLPPRWGAALGNIADAAVRAETLGDAVDKALWLDEAALEAAAPPAAQAERVNVSDLVMVACGEQRVERERERRDENERRLTGNHRSNRSHDGDSLNLDPRLPKPEKKRQTLVRKLLDLKSQLDDARSLAAAAEDARRAAEALAEELREERDNARAALAAHVAELVERSEECSGLRSAVEELTRALGERGGGGGEGKGSDNGGGEASGSDAADDEGGNDDDGGLPSAPKGDTRAAVRDARMARDLSSLEAEKLAAEMISAAEEERGGGGDDFSSLL